MSDLSGEVIDNRYELISLIASGGMASIYKATDLRLDRFVAVKIMHPHLANDEEFVNRFIGMEVIDHGDGYCIIREMGEISGKEFESSLRRIFLLLLDLFDKTIDLIKENAKILPRRIKSWIEIGKMLLEKNRGKNVTKS